MLNMIIDQNLPWIINYTRIIHNQNFYSGSNLTLLTLENGAQTAITPSLSTNKMQLVSVSLPGPFKSQLHTA